MSKIANYAPIEMYVFYKKKTVLYYFFVVPLIMGYLLLFPNLIFQYSEYTKYFMKLPVIAGVLMFSALFGARYIGKHLFLLLLILLFSLNYSLVFGVWVHGYLLQGVLLVLLTALFYRYPFLIGTAIKAGIFISVIFSIQTVIVFVAWYIGYKIPVETVNFEGYGTPTDINLWLGNHGYLRVDWYGFRAQGYFSEANRLAYFLTPSFIFSVYMQMYSRWYKLASPLIAFAIIVTFSVMAFFALGICFYFYRYNTFGKKLKVIMGILFLGFPTLYFLYSMNPDMADHILNRSGSLGTRLLSITLAFTYALSHPLGAGNEWMQEGMIWSVAAGGSIPIFSWLFFTGIPGLSIILMLIAIYAYYLQYLIRYGNRFERTAGYVGMAFLLEQSFYGTYFEFYFVALMAIALALVDHNKRLRRMAAESRDVVT